MAIEHKDKQEVIALTDALFAQIEAFGDEFRGLRGLFASADPKNREAYNRVILTIADYAHAIQEAGGYEYFAYFPKLPFVFPIKEDITTCEDWGKLEDLVKHLYEILRFLRLKKDVKNDFKITTPKAHEIFIVANRLHERRSIDNIAHNIGTSISKLLFTGTINQCNERFAGYVTERIQVELEHGVIPNFIIEFSGFLSEFEALQRPVLITRLRVFAETLNWDFDQEHLILRKKL